MVQLPSAQMPLRRSPHHAPSARRGHASRLAALVVLAGCMSEADITYVDSPIGTVFAADTLVQVDSAVLVGALGCAPGQGLCIARVRDLRWSVLDSAVLRLEVPPDGGGGRLARGLRVGRAFVVGRNASGADSVAIRVVARSFP